MKEFNFSNYYDELVENQIATEEEISLVCNINGSSVETLDDILYTRTGNRSWEQYCYETDTEYVFEDEEDDEYED